MAAPETGTRCEVQFHSAESLEAKELTHDAYKWEERIVARIRASAADDQ